MQDAVRAELGRCAQLETFAGATCLRMAAVLDDPRLPAVQVMTGVEKLQRMMAPLQKLGPREPDKVDEFTERARAKAEAAGG